jgi:hypothetical protein
MIFSFGTKPQFGDVYADLAIYNKGGQVFEKGD